MTSKGCKPVVFLLLVTGLYHKKKLNYLGVTVDGEAIESIANKFSCTGGSGSGQAGFRYLNEFNT